MSDAIDERVMLVLKGYDGKVFVSATMWAATPGCFLQLFKHVTVDRCYNCLEPGHVVAACRARTRCLVCHCSCHVARSCPLLI